MIEIIVKGNKPEATRQLLSSVIKPEVLDKFFKVNV